MASVKVVEDQEKGRKDLSFIAGNTLFFGVRDKHSTTLRWHPPQDKDVPYLIGKLADFYERIRDGQVDVRIVAAEDEAMLTLQGIDGTVAGHPMLKDFYLVRMQTGDTSFGLQGYHGPFFMDTGYVWVRATRPLGAPLYDLVQETIRGRADEPELQALMDKWMDHESFLRQDR